MGKLDSMESNKVQQTGGGAGVGGSNSNININMNINGVEQAAAATKAAPERVKRDEWSEGAVTTLLDAYESKWLLRNRAKLKGNDWEEVARHVSTRVEGTKSSKTQTQCKNKIESMKKRYRAESASGNANTSSWPLYSRLDNLLRCRTVALPALASATQPQDFQEPAAAVPPLPLPLALAAAPHQNGQLHGVEENGGAEAEAEAEAEEEEEHKETRPASVYLCTQLTDRDRDRERDRDRGREIVPRSVGIGVPIIAAFQAGVVAEAEAEAEGRTQEQDSNQEDGSNTLPNNLKESPPLDTDTSTPRSKIANAADDLVKGGIAANFNYSSKRRKGSAGGESSEVAESIRSFADTIMKLEQAKMRMYKDSERLRAETEVRRGEMELKRTEIIAKTQLQIARLLSGKNGKRKFANRNSTLALSAPPEAAAQAPPHPLLKD